MSDEALYAPGRRPAMDLAGESPFALGAFAVRPPTRELELAGRTILLEPRVMQVLVALARRRGEVVSRQDLLDVCWGGRVVSGDAINRCIQAIRRLAEGDGGFSVTTVPRVGYRLEDDPTQPATRLTGRPMAAASDVVRGERRRLTALAYSLGPIASASGEPLDPEDRRAVATRYRRTVAEAVERFGGFIAQGRGENLLVYFGYPLAREDAAERAVRAGLAILEDVAELKGQFAAAYGGDLTVHIGIDAGLALIIGAGENLEITGEAEDAAVRIQRSAAPDTVVLSPTVADLVRGLFRLRAQGEASRLYSVIAPTAATPRRRAASAAGKAPLTGRREELDRLLGCWAEARRGSGQLALVVGEPGIGKSRLVEEFKLRLRGEAHIWLECAALPLFSNTPLHAVAQMLSRGLLGQGGSAARPPIGVLAASLEASGVDPAEAVPLIAEFLGLAPSLEFPAPALSPDEARRRLLSRLTDWALGAGNQPPLVIVVEDVHWLDPSSVELLGLLADRAGSAGVMLLCTARPEFETSWSERPHHVRVALQRLHPDETRALVVGVQAGVGAGLDAGLIQRVVDRADGVPLFAEELTHLLLDRARRSAGGAIPASLLDSLTARLDGLGAARDVAQLAAVVGRVFSYDLLASVSPRPDRDLRSALARLAEADLIQVLGAPPNASYQFRHALIREAAYEGLLKSRRRELHAEVASALAGGNAAAGEARPEVIAQHWADAGEADRAIEAWVQAGQAAEARHAFEEAMHSFRQALAVLATLADTPERDLRELDILGQLGGIVGAKVGHASEIYVAMNARGAQLAEKSGVLFQVMMQSLVSFMVAWSAAETPKIRALAAKVDDLAQREGGDFSLRINQVVQILAAITLGDLEGAERHYVRWLRIVEQFGYGQIVGETMVVFGGLAEVAYYRGRPDLALARLERGLAVARDNNNPHDLALILGASAWVYGLLRDPQAAEAAATAALELALAQNLPQAKHARAALGWARALAGEPGEAIALVKGSLDGWVGGGLPRLVEARRVLAQATAMAGDPAAALAMYDQVFDHHPGNTILRAANLIGRAEIRRQGADLEGAESDWREALALARDAPAGGLELRSATGLAGLLLERSERAAAQALLAPVLAAFDPALKSMDLSEARALLAYIAGKDEPASVAV
jgi:DNA-binding winged helix-turn-helix (wHTH) protein/tetratricopeptide (TPR) repeat protein